jgi:hypothetical protein
MKTLRRLLSFALMLFLTYAFVGLAAFGIVALFTYFLDFKFGDGWPAAIIILICASVAWEASAP